MLGLDLLLHPLVRLGEVLCKLIEQCKKILWLIAVRVAAILLYELFGTLAQIFIFSLGIVNLAVDFLLEGAESTDEDFLVIDAELQSQHLLFLLFGHLSRLVFDDDRLQQCPIGVEALLFVVQSRINCSLLV